MTHLKIGIQFGVVSSDRCTARITCGQPSKGRHNTPLDCR